jgi:DNA-binding GntR family transcriptional regulator
MEITRSAKDHIYGRIVAALSKDITSGRYPAGMRLPTQADLCTQFGASRNSVREALRQLREAGLIDSRQGSGARVERPKRRVYVHSVDSVEELLQWSQETQYVIEKVTMIRADAALARRLGCSVGRTWLHLSGFRYGGHPRSALCWTETYVHHAYARIRATVRQRPGPIYNMIEEMSGDAIMEVRQTARAVPIPARQAKELGVAKNAPGLEMERVYKTGNNRIAEVAFSLHPGERFNASITLRRDTATAVRN